MGNRRIVDYLIRQEQKGRRLLSRPNYLKALGKEEMDPTDLALRIIEDGFYFLIFDNLDWLVKEGKVKIASLTPELIKGGYSLFVVTELKRFVSLGVDPWLIVEWFLKARKGDEIVKHFSQFLANKVKPETLVRRLIKAGNGVEVLDLMSSSAEEGKPYQAPDLVAYGIPAETLAKWLIENDDKEIVEDNFNLFVANGADILRLKKMLN